MPTTPHHRVVRIWCACGHDGLAELPAGVQRQEALRRARCSVCGRKGALDLIVPTTHPGQGSDPERDLAELRARRGW